jgi:hypothetical protein
LDPDALTLQDLFTSAVHEWTAELDRQTAREPERHRAREASSQRGREAERQRAGEPERQRRDAKSEHVPESFRIFGCDI